MKHTILLVDDNQSFCLSMATFLKDEGFNVTVCYDGYEAVAMVRQKMHQFSVALIDYNMPELSGAETIKKIKELNEEIIVYGFSGDDSAKAFTETIKSGGVYVIPKDITEEKLLGLLHGAVQEFENNTKELILDTSETENIQIIQSVQMIGASSSLAFTAKEILKYAKIDSTILIRGENGTGKERVASAIHKLSARNDKQFVLVNCAALNTNLFESELFGHVKGAFTGASTDKKGLFEVANGGTLFLDEFGELPVEMQVKLLRVLQEKTIMRMGSSNEIFIDVRLIIATNRNLESMIKEGLFREDIYYRISAFTIQVAPLRIRKDDIPHLVKCFLDNLNHQYGKQKTILNSSVERLKKYNWPGNVRELENFLARLYCDSEGNILDKKILKDFVENKLSNKENSIELKMGQGKLQKEKSANEKAIYLKAIQGSKTISDVASKLDVARSTVREKFKKYGLTLIK